MKKIVYLVILTAIFASCTKKDDTPSAPVACFSVDATESTDSTHAFLFDQCPPAYDLSYWNFGDGQYSSNPNPSHQFNHYGTYNVKLTVTNTTGESNTVTHTITITLDTSHVDFYAFPRHHGIIIPSQSFYPDTLYFKNHTLTFPGSLAAFDTFYLANPGDTFVHFRIHQPDNMFVFMTGFDTIINMRVMGGIPYSTTADTGSVYFNVPITE